MVHGKMEELNDDLEDTVDKELDETEYLMSTKANRDALNESIKQIEEGNFVIIALEDLWK